MRISAVRTAYPSSAVQKTSMVSKNNYVRLNNEDSTKNDAINFKAKLRWGGAIGGTLGTGLGILAGIGVTVLTGGVAAPFVGAIIGGGVGAITGDVIVHKIDPYEGDDDYGGSDDYYRGDWF